MNNEHILWKSHFVYFSTISSIVLQPTVLVPLVSMRSMQMITRKLNRYKYIFVLFFCFFLLKGSCYQFDSRLHSIKWNKTWITHLFKYEWFVKSVFRSKSMSSVQPRRAAKFKLNYNTTTFPFYSLRTSFFLAIDWIYISTSSISLERKWYIFFFFCIFFSDSLLPFTVIIDITSTYIRINCIWIGICI